MTHSDWHEKYLALQELYDKVVAANERTTHQLMRDLSRISITGNGIDPVLDVHLLKLRSEIRATADPDEIHRICEKISTILRNLDAEHQSRQLLLLEGLKEFLVSASQLKCSRDLHRQINSLQKNIDQYSPEHDATYLIRQHSELLHELYEFLNQKCTELPKQGNWFSNLFTRKTTHKPTTGNVKTNPVDQQALQHVREETSILSAPKASLAVILPNGTSDITPDQINERAIPFSKNAGPMPTPEHVSSELSLLLKQLLDKLVLPDPYQAKKEKLYNQLAMPIAINELSGFIEEITHLLTITLQGEKGRHEAFLSNLNQRLTEVNAFLLAGQQAQVDNDNASQSLEASMKQGVSRIRNSLSSEVSLEALQANIEQHLGYVEQTLDEYQTARERRLQTALQTIQTMQNKLTQTEQLATNLQQALHKERGAANIDQLTGISNRKGYDEYLATCYAAWFEAHDALSLIIADIDHFKQINDSYGHSAGDGVLRVMGAILKNNVRKTDFVARYGGEEFVIVLKGATIDHAVQIAEKLREIVASWKFTHQSEQVKVTLSLGIATFHDKDNDDSVFQRADAALYLAKEQGRNQYKTEQDINEPN